MKTLTIRPYSEYDIDAVTALNEQSVTVLSPMDRKRFERLEASASAVWIAEANKQVLGFLIAFTDGADYDSVNYQWFSQRLKHFLYIDRVVVLKSARSFGIGRQLYAEITQWAKAKGLLWLAAEVDLVPANTQSLIFHERKGFTQVATQSLESAGKTVSLMVKVLD